MDWHQTGNKVIISIFAKCANPLTTVVKVNQVSIDIYVTFGTDSVFNEALQLNGVSLFGVEKNCCRPNQEL